LSCCKVGAAEHSSTAATSSSNSSCVRCACTSHHAEGVSRTKRKVLQKSAALSFIRQGTFVLVPDSKSTATISKPTVALPLTMMGPLPLLSCSVPPNQLIVS
jgi:hypothetical protein